MNDESNFFAESDYNQTFICSPILSNYGWIATIGWLQIQEFNKNQQKRSVIMSWLYEIYNKYVSSSVQFSCSIVSDSLRPHESQHTRPPCPSPSPGVHPDSRPSSPRCHPAISSWVIPFSSCPQSLPASESFPMSRNSWKEFKVKTPEKSLKSKLLKRV